MLATFSAKDPVFKGDNAFVSSLSEATGLEDVAVDNDNLYIWTESGHRQSRECAFNVIYSSSSM